MTATVAPVPSGRTTTSAFSRIYGLGSVYAKTLRDSRLAVIIVAGMVGLLLVSGAAAFGQAYSTLESRAELAQLVASLPPAMAGIYGNPFPINIETLGGSIGWKTAASLGLITSLWSVVALSGTLASEIRRGSLEFVATTPLGRRRIAVEKLAAHLTGMAIVVVVTALACLAGNAFGSLAGDEIPVQAAVGFAAWLGVVSVAGGSVAFALSPILGRGPAGGIAGGIVVLGYFANGYRVAAPVFEPFANLPWFGWTVNHQPLGGQLDWTSLLLPAVLAVALFAVGIVAFTQRDLGATTRIPWPSLPGFALGLGGPLPRPVGERLPGAFWWGTAVALMGFVFGAAATSFSATLAQLSPDTLQIFEAMFPNIDLTSGAGAFLQLGFLTFALIRAGFAASTLVGGWASDETDGRLEMLLATPMSRVRWAVHGGLGLYAAVGVFTLIVMIGIGIGSSISGGD